MPFEIDHNCSCVGPCNQHLRQSGKQHIVYLGMIGSVYIVQQRMCFVRIELDSDRLNRRHPVCRAKKRILQKWWRAL